MGPMPYDNLAALKVAYDSGELGREDVLMLDNDTCFVYTDEGCVYSGPDPMFALQEALTLLGIPWEQV
jgi:hypothetical protein